MFSISEHEVLQNNSLKVFFLFFFLLEPKVLELLENLLVSTKVGTEINADAQLNTVMVVPMVLLIM